MLLRRFDRGDKDRKLLLPRAALQTVDAFNGGLIVRPGAQPVYGLRGERNHPALPQQSGSRLHVIRVESIQKKRLHAAKSFSGMNLFTRQVPSWQFYRACRMVASPKAPHDGLAFDLQERFGKYSKVYGMAES